MNPTNAPNGKRLILASSSPRRRQLMSDHGYEFDVLPASEDAECGVCSGAAPAELVSRYAWQKAADVVAQTDDAIVIAADTVAACHGHILGKPRDREHAESMLRLMSGQRHQVLTGVCTWSVPEHQVCVEVEVTTLRMAALEEGLLQEYLDTDHWIGKAGAFGYQDGIDWVQIESGNESNVVGLPMERVASMLDRIGR